MTSPFAPQEHATADQQLDMLHDLLVARERERVLAHLAACPECEREFQEQFAAREKLRATWTLRRSPEGALEVERREVEPPSARTYRKRLHPPATMRGRFVFGAVAAATAAVVLWLSPWRSPGGNVPTGSALWLPTPTDELRVREETAAPWSRELSDGLAAYAQQDLDAAIEHLGRAETTGVNDLVRRVYLGSALVLAGHHALAVEVLTPLSERPLPDPWGSEARWSLYVALEGCGWSAAADSLLREMAREAGVAGERARAEVKNRSRTGR